MTPVAPGVTQLRIQRFVNVYFIEAATPGDWVLLDTGLPGCARTIGAAAAEKFGEASRPKAIILTHGHLDHLGTAKELAQRWQVPVLAHPLEMPYLTGRALYPPRDPTVGGSLAFMSRFFPAQLPNLREAVQALDPTDAAVPYLPGWRWLHVPGHAPGQIALFRAADRTLLGADAFATCYHDSVPAILLGLPKISRAGTPFNYDWEAARQSVQTLADLGPLAIGCGHGPVVTGAYATTGLRDLADHYPLPAQGRYVATPARTDASGVEYLPPAPPDRLPLQAAMLGAGLLVAGAAWFFSGGRRAPARSQPRPRPEPRPYRRGAGS